MSKLLLALMLWSFDKNHLKRDSGCKVLRNMFTFHFSSPFSNFYLQYISADVSLWFRLTHVWSTFQISCLLLPISVITEIRFQLSYIRFLKFKKIERQNVKDLHLIKRMKIICHTAFLSYLMSYQSRLVGKTKNL